MLLSVGRAVEKKGYGGLLDALATLDSTLYWTLIHIGGGGLLESLKARAKRLNIADRIQWLGAQSQQTVLDYYQRSDIFVLNSCIDKHGDRDGLPNVIVEAQSQGLPVAATDISGIPELIEHQINGLLVKSGAVNALSHSLQQLITDPALRRQLGQAGREKVFTQFDMQSSFSGLRDQLLSLGN